MTATVIPVAMPLAGAPTSDALWVGLVDLESTPTEGLVRLADGEGFSAARLLVRRGGRPIGYVTLPLQDAAVDATALASAVSALDAPVAAPGHLAADELVSVVICTRDRAQLLAEALASVIACDDDLFEIVVVDNAPSSDETERFVTGLDDPRVRYVREDVAGLATARNTGIREARGDLIAFTDDDVAVDAQWIRWLRRAFASAPDVGCVSGLVPSGELRNDVQRYFDARVSWSKVLQRREFRLSDPPADLPMFPFCVGEYGTGANFAVRRSAIEAIGGFDPCLGVGTRTRGGEDIDAFVRLIVAGSALVVEPAAIVWHRHRSDLEALRHQAIGYGTGLGAFLAKVAVRPRLLAMALRRAPSAVVRLVRKPMTTVDDTVLDLSPEMRAVARLELLRVASGPFAYGAERVAGRRRRERVAS